MLVKKTGNEEHILHLNRNLSKPLFFRTVKKEIMKSRSLSLSFSRETLKNGFFELMNALQSIQNHSDEEKNVFSALLQCFLMNSKTSCRKAEYVLVRFMN
jgi:hypothetical protein